MSVIPEGYTELAVTGYSNMGNEYDPEKTYYKYNTVYYDGSTYVILKDGIQGITPTNDGENYRFLAKGFPGAAESVTADDKYDITQEEQDPSGVSVRKTPLQTWIDHAANFIVNKVVHTDAFQNILKQYLANNGTTNQEGFALDARFGKTLQDQVTELDSKSYRFFSIDGSLKTLKELMDLNDGIIFGAIIWISWDSPIAADANNMICIANAGLIWGFSFSGKIYKCMNPSETWSEWVPDNN